MGDTMTISDSLKKTKKQLHESGFKLTPQREATLLVLLENEKDHLSAEEIYFFVKKTWFYFKNDII